MTLSARCLQCGCIFTVEHARMGRKPPGLCSQACRKARRKAQDRGEPVPQPPPEEPLGPELPLDGLSDEERERRRNERILRAAREGVPLWALVERFGPVAETVTRAAGVDMRSDNRLPYGMPA